jgi:AcrR family transcriptional regulator
MPRVTEKYIQRRRREILDAAWRCFARNGFHATTMDDVIDAAGASPSVVYRWFRGKDELIVAAVTEVYEGVTDVMNDLLQTDPPPPLADAVERVLTVTLARTSRDGQDLTALAVQAWSEALRDPTVHQLVTGHYHKLRDGLAELIRRHQAAGTISAHVCAHAAAHALFAMIPGFILQRLLLGTGDPKTYAEAARAILRA